MIPALLLSTGLCAVLGMTLGAMVELFCEVVVSGLPVRVALGAALLQAPRFASLALPMACLAASLFAFSRLSAHSEIVALMASGVSEWRLLVAPLGTALVATALALACNEIVVPSASRRAQAMVETALTTELHSLRPQSHVVYPEYGPPRDQFGGVTGGRPEQVPPGSRRRRVLKRLWHAEHLEGGRMQGLTVLEMEPDGSTRRMSTLELPMPSVVRAANRAASDLHSLSRRDIWRHIHDLQAGPGPKAAQKSTAGAAKESDEVTEALLRLRQRDAAAFSCVVYSLVGAAAVIAKDELDRSSSHGSSTPVIVALACVALYNSLSALAGAAARSRALLPALAAWLPCVAGLGLAPGLLVSCRLVQGSQR
eukprot:jgi/Mesen1/2795/ME000170S01894